MMAIKFDRKLLDCLEHSNSFVESTYDEAGYYSLESDQESCAWRSGSMCLRQEIDRFMRKD